MGIRVEGLENVYLFLLFVLFSKVGERLDTHPMGSYGCPTYCEVAHKHIMEIDGHISDIRTVRETCSSNDSLWVFYLETESMDSVGAP